MIWVDVGWALKGPFFLFSLFSPLWNVLDGLADSKRTCCWLMESSRWHTTVTWDWCRRAFHCADSLEILDRKEKKQNKTECKVVLHAASLGAGRWSGNLADL